MSDMDQTIAPWLERLRSLSDHQKVTELKLLLGRTDKASRDVLSTWLATERDPAVQEELVQAAASARRGDALDQLWLLFRWGTPECRLKAAVSLAGRSEPRSKGMLIGGLADEDRTVKQYCRDFLLADGKEAFTNLIGSVIESEKGEVQVEAIKAAGSLKSRTLLGLLEKAYQRPDPEVERAALEGIVRQLDAGTEGATDALRRLEESILAATVASHELTGEWPASEGPPPEPGAPVRLDRVPLEQARGAASGGGPSAALLSALDGIAGAPGGARPVGGLRQTLRQLLGITTPAPGTRECPRCRQKVPRETELCDFCEAQAAPPPIERGPPGLRKPPPRPFDAPEIRFKTQPDASAKTILFYRIRKSPLTPFFFGLLMIGYGFYLFSQGHMLPGRTILSLGGIVAAKSFLDYVFG